MHNSVCWVISNTPLGQSTPSSAKLSTTFPHSTSATLLQKAKGKQTHVDAFQDKCKTEAIALTNLAADKHARKMAEHDQLMAKLDIKKQQLDIEAAGKRHEAEDRRIAAQHKREHEKEQHEMEMLCLHLQFQGGSEGSGVAGLVMSTVQFGMDQEQFPTPNVFGNLGMGIGGTLWCVEPLSLIPKTFSCSQHSRGDQTSPQ
jgi:hypothetical protein